MSVQQGHRVWSVVLISCFLGCVVIYACQQQTPPFVPPPEEYRTWNLATTIELNYSIPGHLEHYRKIYINAVGYGVQPVEEGDQRTYNYPEGAIIVKELYATLSTPKPGEEPIMLNVMIKAPQHPAAQKGWLWILKNTRTHEERLIDYKFCCDCHSNANEPHPYGDKNPTGSDRDYVYFPPEHTLPKEPLPLKPSSNYTLMLRSPPLFPPQAGGDVHWSTALLFPPLAGGLRGVVRNMSYTYPSGSSFY